MATRSDGARIVWVGTWSGTYTNARVYELLSRLDTIRQFRFPYVRGLSRASLPVQRALLRMVRRRYAAHYCVQLPLLTSFDGQTIVDIDDPRFEVDEVAHLNDPRVAVIVTTTEALRAGFQAAGVRRPVAVMPSGFSARDLVPDWARAIGAAQNPGGAPVVGCVSFALSYRAGDPYSDIDLLLDAMPAVWSRAPDTQVWLLGRPNATILRFAAAEPRVRCFGLVPHRDVLNWIANFTVATYCRRHDSGGWFRIKLIEYMGCGVPVVSTRVGETRLVGEAEAGLYAQDPGEFAEAILALLQDPVYRARLGAQARTFAAPYEWNLIAARYQREILDAYV